ncbi:MAG TPA: hypothetical protein VIY51_16220 [Xanthobacteraceae bacterium]
MAVGQVITGSSAIARDQDDDTAAGQWIPTGQRITPNAAAGAVFTELELGLAELPHFRVNQAVTTLTSHDGKTLLVLTSGYNARWDGTGMSKSEYIFVFDISHGMPKRMQVVEVPNTDSGIVFAPDDRHFYVAGGIDDNVHVFARNGETWSEDKNGAPIALGHHDHGLGIGVTPSAAGLDLAMDGNKLVVADRYNDAVTVIDLVGRRVIGELDLRPGVIDPRMHGVPGGEYPYWVKVKGNDTAYVSSMRDGEIDVIDINGAPRLTARIKVGGTPNRMVLNRMQSLLFVASDNADTVTVIDTATNRVREVIDVIAPPGLLARKQRFRGAAPNALVLSPDERTLYVTLGGENALAVVRLSEKPPDRVAALIPTGWYPNSVSTSADGGMIYVVNGRSSPGEHSGGCSVNDPNPTDCRKKNEYILQLSHAGLVVFPTPSEHDLRQLTDTVAANNSFRIRADRRDEILMMKLRRHIKHVIYVVKENRSYDQVLGDLDRGNGDRSLVLFGTAITPNQHAFARQFVTLDNFYDSGEVSGNGWPWSTQARETDVGVKELPMASVPMRGAFPYDVEGGNRGVNVAIPTLADRKRVNAATPDDPDLLPGITDIAAPAAPTKRVRRGRLWDAALRAGRTVRNYGFYCDVKLQPALERLPFDKQARACSAADPALIARTDIYFRGYDTRYPDFWREKEWEREFATQVAHKTMPNLTLVRFMLDHMGTFGQTLDDVNTPQRQVADNDYAVGRLIEAVALSPYKKSTLIFVVEDDAQDGPDHVDAHRSTAFVVGPFVKQGGRVVSSRYTTVSMLRTIEDILGIAPLSIYDAYARPMTDVFDLKQKNWSYQAAPSACLRRTRLPLPQEKAAADPSLCPAEHSAAFWDEKTKGYDWSEEDRIPTETFNRVLWEGLGQGPYPPARGGREPSPDR